MDKVFQDDADPAPRARPAPAFSLRESLDIAFRDRRRIALTFAVCFALTLLAALLPTSRYVSDASLLVRLGHEYVYLAESADGNGNGGATPLMFDRTEAMSAETEILGSRDLIRDVVAHVGLGRLYPAIAKQSEDPRRPKLDQAVQAFRENLDARLLKGATVIQIGFTHPDPAIAQSALRTLVQTYLERRRAIFSDGQVRFLQGQLGEVDKRLKQAELQLTGFKQAHGIVNYDQQISLLLQQGNDLETRLNETSQQAQTANARAKTLTRIASKTPANLVQYSETLGDPQVPRQLLDLQLKEQNLRSRYLDDNPLVVNASKDVSTAESFIRQQRRAPPTTVRTGRNPVREAAELDLLRAQSDESALAGSRKALQERLTQLRKRGAELTRQQSELAALSREQKLLEDSYANYARKLEAARITEARDQKQRTTVSVLQAASWPLKPKSVRLPILAIGFFVSLGAALLVAFLSQALRSSFQSPEQLERGLGLPVLATMPRVQG
ncbi:GumC family protein [Pseudomonas sp. CGJS7]|uniref:GumC family protein n=1 Tax=Pseudomonas sp. CGJS7 TaxID=3109348 RepID=UPI003009FEEB